ILSVSEGSYEILRAKALRMTVCELFITMTPFGLFIATPFGLFIATPCGLLAPCRLFSNVIYLYINDTLRVIHRLIIYFHL
ncbi:MAG: hypothetical protein ACOX72_08695, partial [Sedimentibacter sp.]